MNKASTLKPAACLLLALLLTACGPQKPQQQSQQQPQQQLADELIAKAEAHKSLNSLVYLDPEALRAEAQRQDQQNQQGPLSGVALVVKDNIHVAGMPNSAGTEGLNGFLPSNDASVVARLRKAGALIAAKANLHELAYGITSNNFYTGAVRNPLQPNYFAGGSSGGTAAAIAAGIVPAGLGTDTGGSTRIPAALTGIVGFRPSMGRYPNDGLTMISNTRDTVGPMAKDVHTAAALDAVMAGDWQAGQALPTLPELSLGRIRLGVVRDYFYQDLEPEVAKAMEASLERLAKAGVTLIELNMPELNALNQAVSFPVVLHETAQLLPAYLNEHNIGLDTDAFIGRIKSPDVKAVVSSALNGAIPADVYQAAITEHRPALQAYYQAVFSKHKLDALVFPTTPLTARPIDGSVEAVSQFSDGQGKQLPTFPSYIRNTDPASNVGSPGISLPMGKNAQGLAMGLELDGPIDSDRHLLAVAAAIEKVVRSSNP